MLAALTNPSNSDIYTTQYAQFVETFSRVGIPEYLPHAFFIAGGGLAIEIAFKVAMDWKVLKNFEKGYTKELGLKVLHFEKAFHGSPLCGQFDLTECNLAQLGYVIDAYRLRVG